MKIFSPSMSSTSFQLFGEISFSRYSSIFEGSWFEKKILGGCYSRGLHVPAVNFTGKESRQLGLSYSPLNFDHLEAQSYGVVHDFFTYI